MMPLEPVLVIGAGKMGGAIISAWLDGSKLDPNALYVEDPQPSGEIIDLLSKYDVSLNSGFSGQGADAPSLVMVGVKPQVMGEVLSELSSRIGPSSLVLSIAAGKTIQNIAKDLPQGTAIVRAMPNTPVMVQAGMTVFVANEFVTAAQRDALSALFDGTGETAWLDDETLMDAVTAVSGSGPAYIFHLAECLAGAGVASGLPPEMAMALAKQTIFGAGSLMANSDVPPDELRVNVTSKGGTTAAALDVLMEGLAPLLKEAVAKATARSKDLSD